MEVVLFLAWLFFWGDCNLYDHLTHNSCIDETVEEEVSK